MVVNKDIGPTDKPLEVLKIGGIIQVEGDPPFAGVQNPYILGGSLYD